jgi:hypothetical protein
MKSTKANTCPATIPTVTYVTKCPSNEREWQKTAQKKRCDELAKYQNCTSPEDFVYHCILNEDGTKLIEVCAPTWFLSGLFYNLADHSPLARNTFVPPSPPWAGNVVDLTDLKVLCLRNILSSLDFGAFRCNTKYGIPLNLRSYLETLLS